MLESAHPPSPSAHVPGGQSYSQMPFPLGLLKFRVKAEDVASDKALV